MKERTLLIPMPTVLGMDEQLLVVDKPAGVLSAPGRGEHPVLTDVLLRAGLVPEDEPFFSVHRLDLDTSGVMLFARTLEAQQHLTRQFEERRVEKSYLALVRGFVATDGVVDAPILADEGAARSKIDLRRGKESLTEYRILERVTGHTLLECRPRTGRMHQIRVHLASIGHPLAVDPLYGGAAQIMLSTLKPGYKPSTRHEERPLIARLTLHAARIALDHPAHAARVSFEAAPPKDFRATLNQLRRL